MAISPLDHVGDLVSFTIMLNGKAIADTVLVQKIQVSKGVNDIPEARISIRDDSQPDVSFSTRVFTSIVPGAEVEIQAGYDGKNITIFKGVIVNLKIRLGEDSVPCLDIACRDKALKLTIGRKHSTFVQQKDSEAIAHIITKAGLKANVTATNTVHENLIQYDATDWDFILSRARANGHLVFVEDGKISVGKLHMSTAPKLGLSLGTDILDIEATLDAESQLLAVSGRAWDISSQKTIQVESSEPAAVKQGNLTGEKLAGVVAPATYGLQTSAPVVKANLKAWVNARLLSSRLARIRGNVSFQGSALLSPGETMALDGLGDRFDGNAFVTAVTHTIEGGNWVTEATFGLPPEAYGPQERQHPEKEKLLPGISGLHTGVVKKVDQDPAGQFRVQVELPTIETPGASIWARMGLPYATNGAGVYFLPEVGDEVVLGFVDNDPRFPVILGGVHSEAHPAPVTPDGENNQKGILTRSKMKLWFDEAEKRITIETPGGHVFVLSDRDQSITLNDSNGNRVELTSAGIVLNSAKDLTLKAAGKIGLEAGAGLNLDARANVDMHGMVVNIKAETSLNAKGNTSASLKSAGQVTVQGAMVMIN